MDYIFFRFVGNREMSRKQAQYFSGNAWKYYFKKLDCPNYSEEQIEEKLKKLVNEGKVKPGKWRVQVINQTLNGKELGGNFYFDIGGFW